MGLPQSPKLTRVDFLHLSLKSRLRRQGGQGGQGDKGAKADPVRSNDSRHSRSALKTYPCENPPSPQATKSPNLQIPPGGDLIDLGIEAKTDRLCNEVSFPPQVPKSPFTEALIVKRTVLIPLIFVHQNFLKFRSRLCLI